jgi:hypothetical protein
MRNNRKKCLVCKAPMARWFYGEPNYEALKDDLLSRAIVIGGCCFNESKPKWACLTCCISYRNDGIGYLDKELIENRNDYSQPYPGEPIKIDEVLPYQLPNKIQDLLKDDFLNQAKTIRSIGFHFDKGGYSSSMDEILYLDGILVWNHYKSQEERYGLERPELPTNVFILSPAWKKKLNSFLISSKWKRNYLDLGVMDGTQWNLTRLVQKKQKKTYGSNDFPKVYEELMGMLELIQSVNSTVEW